MRLGASRGVTLLPWLNGWVIAGLHPDAVACSARPVPDAGTPRGRDFGARGGAFAGSIDISMRDCTTVIVLHEGLLEETPA